MKQKKIMLIALAVVVIVIAFTACKPDPEPVHTHEWEWVETTPATITTDGLETETCKICGATNGTRQITFQSYFYGTWKHEGSGNNSTTTYNITAPKLEYTLFGLTGETFVVSSITSWTPATNDNQDDINTGYINGYIISATITHSSGPRAFNYEVGSTLERFLYLHNDKNSFFLTYTGFSGNIYYKME